MADSTETNADTLRRELQKVLTEILNDGGGNDRDETEAFSGVVKAIDEAVRILTCLRKVESKIPESDISPVEVPKEFICTLSNTIMIEPVIIASGQTYEKRYITEWLKHERTCPKTKQVLSHRLWIPNHLISDLITQWCLVNKYDHQKPSDELVAELFTSDIEALLQRVSSSSSVADQIEAAKELRHQTKKFPNVRVFFVAGIHDSITRLLSPLSTLDEAVDSSLELQENIVTALFNLSILESNKTVIAENCLVIPLLTKSLKQGTDETRRNAAATLSSLSAIDSNKIIIGNSEAVKALIDLIEEGDLLATKEATSTVFNLCIVLENKGKVVSAGLIHAATKKIKAGSNVDELLSLLALISTHNRAVEEMDKLGFIYDLFSILRKPSSLLTGENAVVIVFNMYDRNRDRSRLKVVGEEENQHGTFTKLAKQGSVRAARKAQGILQWIKRFVTGKEPQRA
ncbi:ARM repeat superfamily protein [Arabidopsis thaliana]|uniref:Putative U-box domain-containing protein 46 n=1 Tax=Arabidopsis thaliana TaxID=3702 RepID=PUB46_ARATH|nr:ARM repeat superfamily protein [Arabidopsis thaliana]Q3E9F7.1 RecName: Full=Putative U-box domain-containing protein 46; AltName: Full=Plant U-box protein 46; AltName: Full=RING-type E3 ubiquitin transferase PUB46 [Arabidopsis thaliana]AED92539.1 ARM repeat superfamily protein [Arabidopsis thaliana]|eukprot:NP_197333.2 ARM repeat superfamily protein [Arabidopsis thaliana]